MLEEQDVLEVAGRYLPDGAEVLPTVELDIPAYVRFIDMTMMAIWKWLLLTDAKEERTILSIGIIWRRPIDLCSKYNHSAYQAVPGQGREVST
nr:hypothetical protein [Brevibacillus laterosporus]